MLTDVQTSQVSHPPMRSEPTDYAELLRRLSRVRAALEAAARDNAQLQRQLSAARAENRGLREQLGTLPAPSAHETRRRMLSEPCSRNP
jgi:small-conductance mechanosensitive channel